MDAGILLCPPAGQEYMRMHRAFRWLAEMLARKGYNCLRFDYPGLGDSAGEMIAQKFDDWIASAQSALVELDTLCGAGSRTLIGARLGTIVAANVGVANNVENLVLWEPRIEPDRFIQEMQAMIASGVQPRSNYVDGQGVLHFNGFAFSAAFLNSLVERPFADLDFGKVRRVLVVSSETEAAMEPLLNRIRVTNAGAEFRHVEGLRDWNIVDQIGGIFLPHKVLRTIDDWMP